MIERLRDWSLKGCLAGTIPVWGTNKPPCAWCVLRVSGMGKSAVPWGDLDPWSSLCGEHSMFTAKDLHASQLLVVSWQFRPMFTWYWVMCFKARGRAGLVWCSHMCIYSALSSPAGTLSSCVKARCAKLTPVHWTWHCRGEGDGWWGAVGRAEEICRIGLEKPSFPDFTILPRAGPVGEF